MERVGLSERDSVEAVEAVHLTQLAVGEETSIQGFEIEPGATVPAHSHHHEQTGFVYEGELTFVLEDGSESEARSASTTSSGESEASGGARRLDASGDDGSRERSDPREIVVGPGDSFTIPGGEPHAAENRGEEPVRGVDVFAPPRPDPDWAE